MKKLILAAIIAGLLVVASPAQSRVPSLEECVSTVVRNHVEKEPFPVIGDTVAFICQEQILAQFEELEMDTPTQDQLRLSGAFLAGEEIREALFKAIQYIQGQVNV